MLAGEILANLPRGPIPSKQKLALRRIFSLPNLATLIRLPLAGLLWVRPTSATWLLTIVAIAGISDVVDGRLARLLRRRLVPPQADADRAVGAWLDPLCDKAFAVSTFGVLAVGYEAPLLLLALAATREVLMLPLTAAYHLIPQVSDTLKLDFSSDWTGKLTTVIQFAVIGSILAVPELAWPLAVTAAVVGAGATVHYVRRGIRAARETERIPVRGLDE